MTWLTVLVTLATEDAGPRLAGWRQPAAGAVARGGLRRSGWARLAAGCPWLLPRPWVALLTVPVTLLTCRSRCPRPGDAARGRGGELVAGWPLLPVAAGSARGRGRLAGWRRLRRRWAGPDRPATSWAAPPRAASNWAGTSRTTAAERAG